MTLKTAAAKSSRGCPLYRQGRVPSPGGTRRALFRAMRALSLLVTLLLPVALGACGPDEPQFGAAGVILGKPLPKESATGGAGGGVFGADYDANANKPTTTMSAAHAAKGGPAASDTLDCLSCHTAAGSAKDKAFSFGGRVVRGTSPAVDVDVVVVNGAEKLGPVKSDTDGFFWLLGAPVKAGSKTHVRSAAGIESMSTALGAGAAASCDSANCHVPGKQGKITVP